MRYRQITSSPAFAGVERLTIVPLLPDGTLAALLPMDDDATAGVDAAPGRATPDGGRPVPAAGRTTPDDGVRAPDHGAPDVLRLIHGEVAAGDESIDAAAARIGLTQAGIELGPVQMVGAEGLPAAQHLIVWAQGQPSAQHAQHGVHLQGLAPDELRRRVAPDQGLIPGGASPAWIVADVAATIARRGPSPAGGAGPDQAAPPAR